MSILGLAIILLIFGGPFVLMFWSTNREYERAQARSELQKNDPDELARQDALQKAKNEWRWEHVYKPIGIAIGVLFLLLMIFGGDNSTGGSGSGSGAYDCVEDRFGQC